MVDSAEGSTDRFYAMTTRYHRYLYLSLMVIIVLVLFMVPLVEEGGHPGILLALFFLVFMLRALKILSRMRAVFWTALILAVSAFTAHWLSFALRARLESTASAALSTIGMGAYIVFIVILIGVLLKSIFVGERITSDKIYAAVSGYLLLGILWALIYWVIENIDTTSFGRPIQRWEGNMSELIYFSFTTLTTLGYGDLTPNTPVTQTLTYLEAVSGVLFIAVLIAGIVGMFIAQRICPAPGGKDDRA